jgi:methylated-DNA-[protein]-cysteine S-methyltransferase
MSKLCYTHINSPVGSLMVAGDDDALHYLCFPHSPNAIAPRSDWRQIDAPFLEVRRQLTAYFNGEFPCSNRGGDGYWVFYLLRGHKGN